MRKAVHKKQDLSSLLVMVAFSLFFTVGAAFAQQPAQGGGNSASEQNVEGAPAVRKNYDDRNKHAQRETELKGNGRDAGGPTTITNRSGPYSLVPPMPVWTSNAPANYSHQDTENYTTTGALLTDTSFGIQANGAMTKMVEKAFSPERIMHAASGVGGVAANNTANSEAGVTTNQAYSAIDYCKQFLTNFTAEPGNVWQDIRDHLFIPMAVLLLLPGAVLAQVRAIIAQGSPVLVGEAHPLEGLLKSIVAIFLIPGSFLVINYGIDVANSLTYTVATEYTRIFGSDMYEDAKCAVQRAFPVNRPQDNLNTLRETRQPAASGGFSVFAVLERNTLGIALIDPCLGIYQSILPDETVPQVMNAMRAMVNSMGMTAALSWNLSCAFQMAYLYYLWCMGPIAAALWVWPIAKMKASLGSWVEGVITICFWSLFWNTVILLLACFKGVGFTGTIIVASLLAMAVAAIRSAFDFSGMVTQAVMAAQSAAQAGAAAAMKGSGGGGGGKGGGGSQGGASQGGNQGGNTGGRAPAAADNGSSAAGVGVTPADGQPVAPAGNGVAENRGLGGTQDAATVSPGGSDGAGPSGTADSAAEVPLTGESGNDSMDGGAADVSAVPLSGDASKGANDGRNANAGDLAGPPPMGDAAGLGDAGASGAMPGLNAVAGNTTVAQDTDASVSSRFNAEGEHTARFGSQDNLNTSNNANVDNNSFLGGAAGVFAGEAARGLTPTAFTGANDFNTASPLGLTAGLGGNDGLTAPGGPLDTGIGTGLGTGVGADGNPLTGPGGMPLAGNPNMPGTGDGDLSRVGVDGAPGFSSTMNPQDSAKVAGDMLQAAVSDPQGLTTFNGQQMTNAEAFRAANGVSADAVQNSLQVNPSSPEYGRAVEAAIEGNQIASANPGMFRDAVSNPDGVTSYNGQQMTNAQAFEAANGYSAGSVQAAMAGDVGAHNSINAGQARMEGAQIAGSNPEMYRQALSNPDGITSVGGQQMTNAEAFERSHGVTAEVVQAAMGGNVQAGYAIDSAQARMEGGAIAAAHGDLMQRAISAPSEPVNYGGQTMPAGEAFARATGVSAETVQAAMNGSVDAGRAIDVAQARMDGQSIAGAAGPLYQTALSQPDAPVSMGGQTMPASEAFQRSYGVSAETVQQAAAGNFEAGRLVDTAQARMDGQAIAGSAGQLYQTALSQPDAPVSMGGQVMPASEAFQRSYGVSAETVQAAASGNIEAGRSIDVAQARFEGQSIASSAGALYQTALSQPDAQVMVGNHSMPAGEAFQARYGVSAETVQAASGGNIEAARAIDVAQARIDGQSIAASAGSVYQTALDNPNTPISVGNQTMPAGEAFQQRYGVSAETVQQAMSGNIDAGRMIDAAQTRSEAAQIVQSVGAGYYTAAVSDPNGAAVVGGVPTTNAGAFQMMTGVPAQTVQAALGGNVEAGRVIDTARMESQSLAQGGAPASYSMAMSADGSPVSYSYNSSPQYTVAGGAPTPVDTGSGGVNQGGSIQNVAYAADAPTYNAGFVAGSGGSASSDTSGIGSGGAVTPVYGASAPTGSYDAASGGYVTGTNYVPGVGGGEMMRDFSSQSLSPQSAGNMGDQPVRIEPQGGGNPQPTGDMRMADGGGGGWGHLAQGQGHGGQGQMSAPAPDAASGWGHLAQGQGHGGQAQMPAPSPDAASGWGQAPAQPVQGADAWRVAQANEASAQAWRAPDQGAIEQRQAQPSMPHHDGGMIAPVIIPAANRTPAQPINSGGSRDIAMAKDAQAKEAAAKEAAAKAKAAEAAGEAAGAAEKSTGESLGEQMTQASNRKMGSLRNWAQNSGLDKGKKKKKNPDDPDDSETV
ncbi:MAG: hypothetical protein K2Y32_00745 [Candidatus Obscuribacterales bacterium]|nr:hypothetical protein [Candidatus Obscuribacterales bacterium]